MATEGPAGSGATTESAPSSGGLSLEDAIGSLLGDAYEGDSAPDDGETPTGSTSDAAGAPPAERQAAPDAGHQAPDGTATAERAGAPPADAASVPPSATPETAPPAGSTPPADDPLASATPFTYTVNGASRAFDGIKVLGEHGAIVEPQAVELLQRRLGERDHLFETAREQYARVQDYERLSAWHTKDADGKETVVSGLDGLTTMRVQFGTLAAAYDTMASLFRPDQDGRYSRLAALISLNDKNEIVPNRAELENLLTRSDLAEERAAKQISSHLAALRTTSAPSSTQSTQPDVRQHAPAMIEQAARAAGVDAKVLSDKDRAFLTEQFPRYLRQVTDDDRRANPSLTLGGPIVDESFTRLVKDRVELRTEMAKSVKSAADASAENARKLAAAALGTKTQSPAPTVPPAARPAPTPAASRASDADQAWALRERLSSGRFST